jgi:hypothetical protein
MFDADRTVRREMAALGVLLELCDAGLIPGPEAGQLDQYLAGFKRGVQDVDRERKVAFAVGSGSNEYDFRSGPDYWASYERCGEIAFSLLRERLAQLHG